MFTHWCSGGLEDASLSDSDHEDEAGDIGNGELTGGYTTHKDYEAYVSQSIYHTVPGLKTSVPGRLGGLSDTTHRSASTPCSNTTRS